MAALNARQGETRKNMNPLQVGIIGFGRIGSEHTGWIARSRGVRAVAAADGTPARREKAREGGLAAVESVEALLDDSRIGAVLVSTPTSMHFEHAMAALSAGKHVMIEKPMALDLNQSRALVEEAERRNLVLSVFHNRRWDIDYLTVRAAVETRRLGRILNVESRLGQWSSCVGPAAVEYRPGWRNEASFGGGGLYDWGSHFLDQLWRLMSPAKPLRVFAQLRGNVWSRDCDDFARVCVDFDNGAAGLVEINTTTTRPLPRWHIDGTEGSIDSPHSLAFDLNTWATVSFTPVNAKSSSSRLPRVEDGLNETQIWDLFASSVQGEGVPAVPARTVLPTMALLDAARESAGTGCGVAVRDRVEWIV